MEKMLEELKYRYLNKETIMTIDDKENFKTADECHICNKKYLEKDICVRDHCHITGKYRGSAHQDCNINFQLSDKILIIFHNLRNYDSHFIVQEFGEIAKNYTDKNKSKGLVEPSR